MYFYMCVYMFVCMCMCVYIYKFYQAYWQNFYKRQYSVGQGVRKMSTFHNP